MVLLDTMKATTTSKTLESTGFEVVSEKFVMPINLGSYKHLNTLIPADGDGSSQEELEVNARRSFISKRKWHDFGVVTTIPQLKSVRTGDPRDSRVFEIRNSDGEFAQATIINSPKNEGGIYANQKLFQQLQEAWIAASASGSELLIRTTTRGAWNATSSKTDFMWFDGVQAVIV